MLARKGIEKDTIPVIRQRKYNTTIMVLSDTFECGSQNDRENVLPQYDTPCEANIQNISIKMNLKIYTQL